MTKLTRCVVVVAAACSAVLALAAPSSAACVGEQTIIVAGRRITIDEYCFPPE